MAAKKRTARVQRIPKAASTSDHADGYRMVLEDQTETICRFRPDGTFTYVNEVYCRLFGKMSAELIGHIWHPVVVKEDLPMILEKLRRLSPRNPLVVIENRVHVASGEIRWMQFVNRGLFDKAGRLVETQSVGRDVTERKLAEEALRESEERWKFALEGAGDGVWDWNVVTGDVLFSKQWKSMIGFKEHEIADHFDEWSQRVHPDDLAGALAGVEAHFDGRTPAYTSEFRMRCKDGTWKWILARGMATTRDGKGRPLRAIGTHQDISARMAAKEREDNNLKLIAEGAPCESVLDAIMRSVEAEHSGMLCSVMLVDAGGARVLDVIAPRLPAFFRKALKGSAITPDMKCAVSAVRTGRRVVTEDIRSGGRAGPFEKLAAKAKLRSCWSEPVIGSSGIIFGTIVCFHRAPHSPAGAEISAVSAAASLAALAIERRQAEEAFRESEERYRRIVQTAEEGVWTIDAASLTDYVNPKMARMMGYTAEEMLGRPLDDFMDDEGRALLVKLLKRRKGGISEQFEFKYLRKDGSKLWAFVSTNPITNSSGVYVGAMALLTDISSLKEAQAALLDREARYRGIMESQLVGLIFWNLNGDITEANDAFLKMVGFTQEDVWAGLLCWKQLTPAEHRNADERAVEEILSRGVITPFEKEFFRKDGSRVPIILGGALFPHRPNEGVSFVLDITARKKAEAALHESEERYARAMRGTSDGLWDWLIPTGEVYLSSRWKELLGFLDHELPNHQDSFFKRVHPDDADRVRDAVKAHLETDAAYDIELRLRTKSGGYRWVRSRGEVERDETGHATHMAGTISDITERKLAEEKFAREQEFNKALVGNTSALIVVLDEQSRVIHVNPAFEKELGRGLADIGGRPLWESGMMSAAEIPRSKERYRQISNGVEPAPVEIRLCARNGEWHVLELRPTATYHADRSLDRIILTFTDITERTRLQKEVLKISEQEQASIGHNLHDGVGQTMSGIASMLEHLESGLSGGQKQMATRIRELMQESVAEVRRMSHGLSPVSVQLRGLVGGLHLLAETIRTNYRAEAVSELDPGIIINDPEKETHLYRIAQEAVNNALRHGRAKRISITLRRVSKAECSLHIEDNGSGMSKTAAKKSDGVGLRVMQYRANLIGGEIQVTSRPGRGVTVTCRFPCHCAPVPKSGKRAKKPR